MCRPAATATINPFAKTGVIQTYRKKLVILQKHSDIMKRILLAISMLIAVATSAFAGAIDDKCATVYDAIIAGDIARAEDITSEIYAQKATCSATNLADMAIIYHRLLEKSDDAVTRYDYALKTIDCYKSAIAKDATIARQRFAAKKVDMDAIARGYESDMPKFQQAISESMNF